MEREIDYDLGNGQLMSQKIPENKNIEIEIEIELASIVYIFYSKNEQGIKFYDRTPEGMEAKIIGDLPDGKFKTDKYSISLVNWNDEVNIENTTELYRVRDGSVAVRTIMVSEEKYMEIADSILKQQNNDEIIIDTRNINYDNSNEFSETNGLKM